MDPRFLSQVSQHKTGGKTGVFEDKSHLSPWGDGNCIRLGLTVVFLPVVTVFIFLVPLFLFN
jgi:hypothetical protein